MSRRIRTIKPEVLVEDERAAELSDAAWRLWVAVRTFADDFGSFRAGPRHLAAMVWQDTARAKRIPALLEELATAGKIGLYAFEGQPYGRIAGWDDEQRIDYRCTKTRLPCPTSDGVEVLRDLARIFGTRDAEVSKIPVASPKIGKASARARVRDPIQSLPASDPSPIQSEPLALPRAFALAYARGVTAGVGAPQGPPSSPTDTDRLVGLLEAHGLMGDPQKAIAWLEVTAEEFARAPGTFGAKTGFGTYAFVGWVNGRSVPKPGVQPAAKGGPSWSSRNPNVVSVAAGAEKGPGHGVDR